MASTVFAGSKVKTLKDTLSLNGGADVISSTTNPQSVAVNAAAGSLLLNTSSGIMYRKLDAGSTTNWVEVGSGAGTKNYIKNPDFDGGSTTNWAIKKVSLSSLIPTGNIGTADAGHTIEASSSSPLEGSNSLLVKGTSLFTAGNCLVSDAFTIDKEDQAKVMGWSFYYEAVTTNMDFPGTSSNTWAVYIAEVTTATPDTVVSWIQPAGVYNLTQGTGVGLASGTFQTTASGTAYRLVLVCINSEAAATTLKVDDFQLGPQKVVYGSPITDWQDYTPTVSWSTGVNTPTGKWRRVGDSIEISAAVAINATLSGTTGLTFSIPAGLTIDSTKFASTASYNPVGTAEGIDVSIGNTAYSFQVVRITGQNVLRLFYQNTTTATQAPVNQTTPITWENGDNVQINALVPISGWSSSVQMSNDTDTRVVAATLTRATAQTITSTSATKVQLSAAPVDTHATADVSTNYRYVIPVSGFYKVSGSVAFSNFTATEAATARITLTGTEIIAGADTVGGANPFVPLPPKVIKAVAGDYVELFAQSITDTSYDVGGNASTTFLSVERLSGPAAIAASETVGVHAYKTSGSHTSTANWQTVASYTTEEFDTHDAFNMTTGIYTVPVSGKYLLAGNVTFQLNATGGRQIRFLKNGAALGGGFSNHTSGSAVFESGMSASVLVNCKAGETLQMDAYQSSGGNLAYSTFVDAATQLSIIRVGN